MYSILLLNLERDEIDSTEMLINLERDETDSTSDSTTKINFKKTFVFFVYV